MSTTMMPGTMPEAMSNAKPDDPLPSDTTPAPTPAVATVFSAETMHALTATVIETPQMVKAEFLDLMDRLSKMLLDSCAYAPRVVSG